MRYLNKIVFINSASVVHAEIELDGNVHFIGTQGVGKSTLLRAILFFYNANKIKLGIPREKKSFDEYYFAYQNSYIIYEVIKEGIPYCVLAYKANGKVAFRFFDAAYKKELFIDENNRAFESWDNIRNAFGRAIHYSTLVASYEEFRKIIYGDNKGLKPEFRSYAILESKQFQNIPRTIQNVFLNSNLEAKFIKDTIINSLNEDEFVIDIENYSKNHLRDFESQIKDIKMWFEENKKGQVKIRKQANQVIVLWRNFNFLKREKKNLAFQLASRLTYLDTEKPLVVSNFTREKEVLHQLLKQKDKLAETHKKREQKLISEIDYLKKELTKASKKEAEYVAKNISSVLQKGAKKQALANQKQALEEERNLLTSQFAEVQQKYEALILQLQNHQEKFENKQIAEINALDRKYSDDKTKITASFQQLIEQIRANYKTEKEKAHNQLQRISEEENQLKTKKLELKYQPFFDEEIQHCKEGETKLKTQIAASQNILLNAKNQTQTTRKEWELEASKVEQEHSTVIEKQVKQQQDLSEKNRDLEQKINQSKTSFYGWLSENYPNWENRIGKVIDVEKVLFNSQLNPQLQEEDSTSFFGVKVNLDALPSSIKTVEDYQQDLATNTKRLAEIQQLIQQTQTHKEADLNKLKTNYRKKLNAFKESIAEQEYTIAHGQEKLKKNKVEWDEWEAKAKQEKKRLFDELETALEKLAFQRLEAQKEVERIKSGIKRKITVKENDRNAEIKQFEQLKNKQILALETSITENKKSLSQRIQEIKEKQTSALENKGADIQRLQEIELELDPILKDLAFIATNERLVIEYEKDKRELLDKVPSLKAERVSLEKKQSLIAEEHQVEMNKIQRKCSKQTDSVHRIEAKINEFDKDLETFESFKKSEAFASIETYFSAPSSQDEASTTAVAIISELNEKHYKDISIFRELQQAINSFVGNFGEQNIFRFKVKLNSDQEYVDFASDLKEFIEEDKIHEFEKRVNERFASIIHLIGRETTELNSKEAEIEKIIKKINDDFINKNFVQAIKEMEMRTKESSNPIVKLLVKIKEFNDENSLSIGEANLFTSSDANSQNQKAVDLLKKLIDEIEKSRSTSLTLSESFDLQFRIVENDNDSGWVEKLANVGSEGTDVLVKAMINILLLNVFKNSASRKVKDFKLHCMMDEIGRLHPTNVKGILRFANERNILLINGSPTSQNATDYKYTYKLAKEQAKNNPKKYITKVNRLVKVNSKIQN